VDGLPVQSVKNIDPNAKPVQLNCTTTLGIDVASVIGCLFVCLFWIWICFVSFISFLAVTYFSMCGY
jgi:hypothetical protein